MDFTLFNCVVCNTEFYRFKNQSKICEYCLDKQSEKMEINMKVLVCAYKLEKRGINHVQDESGLWYVEPNIVKISTIAESGVNTVFDTDLYITNPSLFYDGLESIMDKDFEITPMGLLELQLMIQDLINMLLSLNELIFDKPIDAPDAIYIPKNSLFDDYEKIGPL
jgi:hypothetical protein